MGFGLLLVAGCEVINPPEEIPSYLYIDNFTVNSSPNKGGNSSSITEAFVFVDNGFVGAYSLPATFPVLKTGTQRVDIFTGIKDNGIDATPEIYPFYTSVTLELDLVATEVDTIRPVVEYVDNAQFSIVENFENTLQVFRDDLDGNDQTFVDLTTEDVFDGEKSGLILLSDENPVIQVGTNRQTDMPSANREVYLEMDYKTEVIFEVGIFYYNDVGERLAEFQHGLNPTTEWTKVYINLTPEFNALSEFIDIEEYQIGVRALMEIDDNGNYLEGERKILLDNVKFIYF